MDSGAPSSIGGTVSAAALCEALGIELILIPPKEFFIHGWGPKMLDPKPICCSWELPVQKVDGSTRSFLFHLLHGDDPLVIGDDVTKSATVDNINNLLSICEEDGSYSTFHTYHTEGEGRRRLSVLPPPLQYSTESLSRNLSSYFSLKAVHFAKLGPRRMAARLHDYSHATFEEMKRICGMAGILDHPLKLALEEKVASCDTCCRTGRPKNARTVSITHIGSSFNQSVQVDFFFPKIRGQTRILLHMRDRATGYSEVEAVPTRDLLDATVSFDRTWISRHGAPISVSGDQEFNRQPFKDLLEKHSCAFEIRPSRRHNKVGSVERKNAILRLILERISKFSPELTVSSTIARSNFLSNLFSGSKLLSSFEQVRGYTPGICGLPNRTVPTDLIDAHKERMASRALHRLFSSKSPKLLTAKALPQGTKIYALLKSGSWEPLVVSEALQHYIIARRNAKGAPLHVAYEDIRIAPSSMVNKEMTRIELRGDLDIANPSVAVDAGGEMSCTVPTDPETAHPDNVRSGTVLKHAASRIPSFLAFRRSTGQMERDIVVPHCRGTLSHGTELLSDEQRVLASIEEVIGPSQVTSNKLTFAPAWIIQKSFEKELDNWKGVYEVLSDDQVPLNANVIRSHTVFKIKKDEKSVRSLKARIVAHGNEDKEKDTVRKDSAAAQFTVIRLLLSLAAILRFRLAKIDVKKAYLQSGPIQRTIYVRPPRELYKIPSEKPRVSRGILWKLLKLPYGIVEAGRQWQLFAESWMIDVLSFSRIPALSQIFVKRSNSGLITLIVEKVIDDFLIAGNLPDIEWFIAEAEKKFEIGCTVVDEDIKYNGAEITQNSHGTIHLSMREYSTRLKMVQLSRSRQKQRDSLATPDEVSEYQHMAGVLNFYGKGVLPHASFVTSYMLQKVPRLKVSGIVTANAMVKELLKLAPVIKFTSPTQGSNPDPFVCSFSDASYNISSTQSYGQTGIITGLAIPQQGHLLFHPVDWASSKQRRVTYSSFGAEILACAEADDRSYSIRQAYRILLNKDGLQSHLHVDSRGLFDTITTLHEGRDYRLRQTVQRIRDSFEAKEFDVLRWIKGSTNIADALTKRNVVLYRLLNDIFSDGCLHVNLDQGFQLSSQEWCPHD